MPLNNISTARFPLPVYEDVSGEGRKAPVVSYVNAVSGTGKTTQILACSLVMAAVKGRRVLIIDMDSNCGLTKRVALDKLHLYNTTSMYNLYQSGVVIPGHGHKRDDVVFHVNLLEINCQHNYSADQQRPDVLDDNMNGHRIFVMAGSTDNIVLNEMLRMCHNPNEGLALNFARAALNKLARACAADVVMVDLGVECSLLNTAFLQASTNFVFTANMVCGYHYRKSLDGMIKVINSMLTVKISKASGGNTKTPAFIGWVLIRQEADGLSDEAITDYYESVVRKIPRRFIKGSDEKLKTPVGILVESRVFSFNAGGNPLCYPEFLCNPPIGKADRINEVVLSN